MNRTSFAAALTLITLPAFAQEPARTGVSNPEPVVITAAPDETVTVKVQPAKPSAAKPELPARAVPAPEVYGAYVPYRATGTTAAHTSAPIDPDATVVTSVPETPGEVNEGTLIHARIRERLSTLTTAAGTAFTAELTDAVTTSGRVVLPQGSLVQGRVTEVRGGRRLGGRAMMHLQPREIVLPDGTRYSIQAQLIDTNLISQTSIDSEGTLHRKDHPKEMLAVMGATTGAAAVTGALIGGGVGAAVGAGLAVGVSTVVWLKEDRQTEIPAETQLIFSLTAPMEIRPEGGSDRISGPVRRPLPAGAATGTEPRRATCVSPAVRGV